MVLAGQSLAAACNVDQLSTEATRTLFHLESIGANQLQEFVVFDRIATYNGCSQIDYCLDFHDEARRDDMAQHNYCLACDQNGNLQPDPPGCNNDLRIVETSQGDGASHALIYDVTNRTTNITFDLRIFSNGFRRDEFIPRVTILVAKVCRSQLAVAPQRIKQYFVPEYGFAEVSAWPDSQEEIWLDDTSQFFVEQATLDGCNRFYSMQPTYEDLRIDQFTGKIMLTNRNVKADYDFDIIISHTGGYEGTNYQHSNYTAYDQPSDTAEFNPPLVLEGFRVSTVCGPDSTTVGPPTNEVPLHPSEDGQFSMGKFFTNTNPNCPIVTIQNNQDCTDLGFGLDHTTGMNDYNISLSPSKSSTMGIYQYCATATADGGAFNTITQQVQVTKTCTCVERTDIQKRFTFDIPEYASDPPETVNLNYAMTDFIQSPLSGCSQTFEISPMSSNIQISPQGIISFVNRPIRTSMTFNLNVRNTGGTTLLHNGIDRTLQYNPICTIQGFEIQSDCGVYSTTIGSKVLPTAIYTSNGNIPSSVLNFENSNPQCEIQTVETTTQGSSICRISRYNSQYSMTTQTQMPACGAYECYSQATARGGATGTISMHFYMPCQSEYSYCVPAQSNILDYDYEYLPATLYSPRLRTPFNFVMANGHHRPEELIYVTDTNQIRLTNRASQLQQYDISITLQSSQIPFVTPEIVQNISFSTVCCSSSTILTPPDIQNEFRIPNCASNQYDEPVRNRFQSLNPACPVIAHSLVSGQAHFDLIDQGSTFTVTRKENVGQFDQDYSYTVQATALGGAQAQAIGRQSILSVCRAQLVSNFQTTYRISVPKSGFVYETFPASSSEYVSAPPTSQEYLAAGYSCSQSFSYRMRPYNNLENPEELTINPTTGVFTLKNSADVLTVYSVDIIIVTSDGCSHENDFQQTVSITIYTECGPESTALTPPDMAPICQTRQSNQLGQLSQTGTFTSLNSNCPVQSHTMITGWDNYILDDRGTSFALQMTNQAASVNLMTTYYYVVQATAKGGATSETIGQMIIEQSCQPSERSFNKNWNLMIPESGYADETFPSNSTDYISAPTTNCQREFFYRMKGAPDDSWNSPDLTMDPVTGLFTVRKYFDQCRNYQVDVIVRSVDTCGNTYDYTVQDINIHTVCGINSTTVTPPQTYALAQGSTDQDDLSLTDQFISSNPFCPIEDCQKTSEYAATQSSGTQLFDLVPFTRYPMFKLTLREQVQQRVDDYQFSLRCTAKGGASAEFSSVMSIYNSCQNKLNQAFYKKINLCLPENLNNQDYVIPVTEYLEEVIPSCQYFYTITMNDQSYVPPELNIDQGTGDIRLSMSYNRMRDYNFNIQIQARDVTNVDLTTIPNVQISIGCCPESTTITATEPLQQISRPVNLDAHVMQTSGSFQTSNNLCPVYYVKLDSPSKQYYTLEVTGGIYQLQLRPQFAYTQGTYYYTIMYEAKGGATTTTQGNMVVGPSSYDCNDAMAQTVPSLVQYDIPLPDETVQQTVVDFGPYRNCISNIQLENSNGGYSVPSYYHIDQEQRVVHFNNQGNQRINDFIRLRLTWSQAGNTELTNTINVKTQCGPQSTQVVSPVLHKLILPEERTITERFTSTNGLCPVVSYALEAEGGDYVSRTPASQFFDFSVIDYLSVADEFRVTLKDYYTRRVDDYYFYVTARAEGGAMDTAAGYMSVLTVPVSFVEVTMSVNDTSPVNMSEQALEIVSETEEETEIENISTDTETEIEVVEETEIENISTDTETEIEVDQEDEETPTLVVVDDPVVEESSTEVEEVFVRSNQWEEDEKNNNPAVIIIVLVLLAILLVGCCCYFTNCCQSLQQQPQSQSAVQSNSRQTSRVDDRKRKPKDVQVAPPAQQDEFKVPTAMNSKRQRLSQKQLIKSEQVQEQPTPAPQVIPVDLEKRSDDTVVEEITSPRLPFPSQRRLLNMEAIGDDEMDDANDEDEGVQEIGASKARNSAVIQQRDTVNQLEQIQIVFDENN